MLGLVLAGPRQLVRGARKVVATAWHAAESVPRIASALDDIRATLHHIERLAAYVAEELPELAYQLEQLRARVDEREDEEKLSPASPRTG
jgi:hypothetical protein